MKRTSKSKIAGFNLGLDTTSKTSPQSSNISSPISVSIQVNIIAPVFIINEMDKIVDGLWLGGSVSERSLVDNEFTHVLSIVEHEPSHITCSNFITKWINIEDDGKLNIANYFDECNDFIQQALLHGGKIYVHCQRGLSRSPTIIIAYLMRYKELRFDDALRFVSSKRPTICPNLGFSLMLRQYELIVFNEHTDN